MLGGMLLPILLSSLHLVNDLFSGFTTPLMPRLMEVFGVGLGTIGLLVSVYSLTSSLLQPFAGLVADRYDRRMLAALGPLAVALGMGTLGFWTNFWGLLAMVGLAGIGSALFHAAGAALVGQYASPTRRGFWLSFFGSSGYLGISLAPLVSLEVVHLTGGNIRALAWLIPLALIPSVWLLLKSPPMHLRSKPAGFADLITVFRGQIARLWAVATLRSLVFMSFSTSIPFWFLQRGLSENDYQLALILYSFSGTAGAFLGGTLSDRFGRRWVLVGTMFFAIPLYVALLSLAPGTPVYLVLLVVTGALMNAAIPVTVVMAQEHAPHQIATVSGLLMGFTWGFAGLFYGVVAQAIEAFGLMPVLWVLGILLVPSLTLALGLREARPQSA